MRYTYRCEKCGKEIITDKRYQPDAVHGKNDDGEYCGGNLVRVYEATPVYIKGIK